MRRIAALVPVLGALVLAHVACVHDVVLPDQAVTAECGNGVLEPGEDCDVASAGCTACSVVPTWTCNEAGCETTCGDGVIGGARCEAARRESTCDLSGWWAARESTYLREAILGSVQVSSTWFLFHLEQEGESFRFDADIDCGILVTGSANVRYSPAGLRANLHANAMDGSGGRAARRGTSRAVAGGCDVALDRWYNVRGMAASLLPADFAAKPTLAALPPVPAVRDPIAGTEAPEGATDPDGDGLPGLAFSIVGLASGIRNVGQRDWKEFASLAGAPVPERAMAFVLPGAFDLQESIVRVTDCGSSCGLLTTPARVAQDIPARLAFSYVGRALDGVRTRQVVGAPPREDLDADLAACANVRLLLPHDPSVP